MKLDQTDIYICTEGRQGENFLFQVTTLAIYGDPAHCSAYILKSSDADDQTPQIIWTFRRKIFWERENY